MWSAYARWAGWQPRCGGPWSDRNARQPMVSRATLAESGSAQQMEWLMNDRAWLEDRLLELKEQVAQGRRRGRRQTVLNVVLAVCVLALGGAGAAYALAPANSVNSASIIDRSIGTPDVKVGAFAGQTILDNSLTGKDINESTLKLPIDVTTVRET